MRGVKDNRFDFIVSIGEACACSAYLREHRLQYASYPFDWLTAAPFQTRIDLLAGNFERFLEKEDLAFLPKPEKGDTDSRCDYYENRFNRFYFYHDFPTGVPLDISFPQVAQKYGRRIKRLYEKINRSQSVLFVWFSRDKRLSGEAVRTAFEKLNARFPGKTLRFLILENDPSARETAFETDPDVYERYTYDMFSADADTPLSIVQGNKERAGNVFCRFKLKKPLLFWLKRGFAALMPVRSVRRRIRKWAGESL